MSFLAKELNLLVSKAKSDEVEINSRTKEFIKSIQDALKNMCLHNSGIEVLPKCDAGKTNKALLMDIPKEADFDELLTWLNSEKIPFDIIFEYRSANLYMKRLRLTPKEILLWVKQNG